MSNLFLTADNKVDFIPNELYSEFNIHHGENYDQVIKDQYKEEQGIDYNYNALFEYNKKAFKKQISENLGKVSRDPNITKYDDTYSVTPYATYIMTPLSGADIEFVVSRFDNCVGEWKHNDEDCGNDNTTPCKRYTKEYEI